MTTPTAPTGLVVTGITETGFTIQWVAAVDPPEPDAVETPTNVVARIDGDRALDVAFTGIPDATADYRIYVNGTLMGAVAAGATTEATIDLGTPEVGTEYTVVVSAVSGGNESSPSESATAVVPLTDVARIEDIALHAEALPGVTVYPAIGESVSYTVNWAGSEDAAPFSGGFSLADGSAVYTPLEQSEWLTGLRLTNVRDDVTFNAVANFANGVVKTREIRVVPVDG